MPRTATAARLDIAYEAVAACLEDPPTDLWTPAGETGPTMRAQLPGGIEVEHPVEVTMGEFYRLDEPVHVCGRDVTIEASDHRALFPRFTGSLEANPLDGVTELEMAGTYELPGGLVGMVADAAMLGRLAPATLTDLFGVVLQHLTACAAARQMQT
jgi:hypothetical protein